MPLFWFYVASTVLSMVQARAQAKLQREQGRIAGILGQTTLEGAIFEAELNRKAGADQAQAIRTDSARAEGAAVVQVATSGVELSGSPLVAIIGGVADAMDAAAEAETRAQLAGASAESRGRAAFATGRAANAVAVQQSKNLISAGWLKMISFGVKSSARNQQQTGGPTSTGSSGVS